MTPEERLAGIIAALEAVGISCLVMGGHAVWFYGLARNTNDFDLTVAPASWDDLANNLAWSTLLGGRSPSNRTHYRQPHLKCTTETTDRNRKFMRDDILHGLHL